MTNRFVPVEWSHNTNIYEVNVRQYTPEGTFAAFLKHLPRLQQMGVKTLWFMPITPIAQKNKKGVLGSYYACSDYTAINPEFGNLEEFKNLIRLAHEMGFKVILDWVANHTGWDHRWTKEHPAYYNMDTATNDFKMPGGMEDIIELNFDNAALKKAMIDAMKFWVSECDIDGFRCDLASWVILDFWKVARKELDEVKHLFWLGEYDELENPEYGEAFDASYSWKWMHKTKEFCEQKLTLKYLLTILKSYDDLGDTTMRTWFTTNHDENSWNGTEYEKYGDMAKALAVFSCTWNGIPLLYSGQELPNLKRLAFFEKDVIEWNELIELDSFYHSLLTLRISNPALRSGDAETKTFILKTNESEKVLAYVRKSGSKEVLVMLNFSASEIPQFEISDAEVTGFYKNIFTGIENDFTVEKNFSMKAWEYLVFEK